MVDLLEGVRTDKLRTAYDKYLPAVLNNAHPVAATKQTLSESRSVVTGNKAAKTASQTEVSNNVVEMKRLAGLN
jgi:homoserine dehydrogenase